MRSVLEFLNNTCGIKLRQDQMNLDLFEAGLIDSMNLIYLLTEIELEYDIEIDPRYIKINMMNTPEKIIEYVEKYK